MERKSHVYGNIRVYAPDGAPSTWKDSPWILITEKGGEGNAPISVHLKSACVGEVFKRPFIIRKSMVYND